MRACLRAYLALIVLFGASMWVGRTPPASEHRVTRDPFISPEPVRAFTLAPEDQHAIRHPPTTVAPRVHVARASRSAPPRVVSAYDDAFWRRLANCESSDGRSSASGKYHGYFQFSMASWRSAGGAGVPSDHDYGYQLAVAKAWAARTNPWKQWPVCWAKAARG